MDYHVNSLGSMVVHLVLTVVVNRSRTGPNDGGKKTAEIGVASRGPALSSGTAGI